MLQLDVSSKLLGVITVYALMTLIAVAITIRYSYLLHEFIDWEIQILRSNKFITHWIPSSKYVTLKRIFFIENWKLPIAE